MSVVEDVLPSRFSISGMDARRKITLLVTILFFAILIFATVTTTGFYSVQNFKAIITAAAIVGIIAVGMTYIVISGNLFSLSVGITAAVSASTFIWALRFGLVGAVIIAVVFGAVVIGLQGLLIGFTGANPIIVTIAAGALQEAVAIWITGGVSVYPPENSPSFAFLVSPLFGIPFPVYVFVVAVVLGEVFIKRSRFGRGVYLMGESPRAGRTAGLPITRLTTGAFVVAGVCAAVAGILIGAFNQSGTMTASGTLTIDSISAVLVGGTAVIGGRGSVVRTAIGAIVIATISDLLLLRGYSTPVQLLVLGVIVTVVVILSYLNSERAGRS
jgi:ribose/xylose/arabinose/galactoside ABC-type transport system permease subunit